MALTRRQFLIRTSLAVGGLASVNALAVEPNWIEVTHHDFTHFGLRKTIVHLTDIHYTGDIRQLERVMEKAHAQKPDALCFTGDLVSKRDGQMFKTAMEVLGDTSTPLFGCLGNHDPVDPGSLRFAREIAAKTGGAWLMNESVDVGDCYIEGLSHRRGMVRKTPGTVEEKRCILLCHYPSIVDEMRKPKVYDLILAGHSHGGQCRIPGLPPLFLPLGVGPYVAGLFNTAVGALYVSRGIGTTGLPVRFACRPEIAVFHL